MVTTAKPTARQLWLARHAFGESATFGYRIGWVLMTSRIDNPQGLRFYSVEGSGRTVQRALEDAISSRSKRALRSIHHRRGRVRFLR